MPDTFNNLWASLKIFQSNFNARYGSLFNLIVAASVLALILFVLIRAALAGRKGRRGPSPMHGTPPDHNLTQRAAQSLSYAVRIPSVTGDIEALKAMNQFLRQRYPMVMETMDCACLPDGSMLLRWRSPRTKLDPVLLCGHLDVVPGGEGWTVCQPFEGLREEGRIYGRGAVDCKGVVIAMLEAAESLIAQGFMPKREVYFAFGADEEIGGPKGSRAIAATLERQGMKFDLILDEGGSIEDTRRDGRKHAAAFVGMGEKRQCTMGLTVHCPGGHSSQPGRVTALGMLSEAICRVESAQPHIRVTPLVRRTLESSMAAFPFGKRLVLSSRLLFRLAGGRIFRGDPEMMALLRTTVAVTRIDGSFPAPNMLPATAAALLNVRLLPGDKPEALRADLKSLLADLPIEVELLSVGEESFITLEQQPMYRMLRDVLLERYPNLPCVPTLMTSACDARHYSNLSDCILRFSPMVTGENAGWNWHAGNEFLSERSLGIAAEVYRDLLRRL